MLNFPTIPTKAELRDAAKIEFRRRNEELRRCRIFDPKTRQIGVDLQFLEQQIAEKKRLRDEKRDFDDAYLKQMQKEAEASLALESLREKKKRQWLEEINNFRKNYQRVEDRREFDISDPDYLKKSTPVRIDDEDPRLTPSSIQKFEGEDLCKPHRLKLQAEQKLAWYQQQTQEKRMADSMQCKAEDEYQKAIISRDLRACQLDSLEREIRQNLDKTTKEFNRALANEMRDRQRHEADREQADAQAHMYNVITSDMMTENREVGFTVTGQIVPSMYRGLTEEQLVTVREELMRQVEERKNEEELRKRRDDEWVKVAINMAHAADQKEKEYKRYKKMLEARIAEQNKEMGEIQRERNVRMAALKSSDVTCEYYNNFGTSTR